MTAPAWRAKPTWYQISSQDHMIHPDNERHMAERMSPRKIIELDTGHASLASQPGPVAELIETAAVDLAG
ncbi:alpha/beta hydrolase [Streptomyces diastatochromogenes]|uniref:alpha/beta hydrolase n=1 Tax=Streptomyces diastatochromogenes TaxID=42236 RepID=UPI001FC94B80|nr:alpha/beta hydrolase [Streptomyces diastatochromogenes]MCZ0984837.1 alpha/beta hydrolase [Streptomyces diastatochromogenes]